jgi:hypothetical protein
MQMDLQKHIDQVIGVPGDHRTIQAARMLASCTDDHQVMDALCEAAVSTTSHKVREVLIDVLKTESGGRMQALFGLCAVVGPSILPKMGAGESQFDGLPVCQKCGDQRIE